MDHAKLAVLASRNWLGGYRCRFGGLLVPPAPLPLTTARVGVGTLVVFGDYQIAPIAAQSTAMGRWRLTPPWYWGDTACGRGIGSFAPPGASSFLSSLKESYQRKPLETTFQDFLGAGTAGANLTVCTRGRGAAVITVGQKDCACVHRRGGWRGRLPQPR